VGGRSVTGNPVIVIALRASADAVCA
jgi:hypothetical protein